MRQQDRRVARLKLDMEMRPFRRAATQKDPTNELLRAVRRALGVPLKEITENMGVGRSSVFELEENERKRAISLRAMARMAEAMGCKVVYGIVPENGKTLEELAEERLWRSVLASHQESKSAGPQLRQFSSQAGKQISGLAIQEEPDGISAEQERESKEEVRYKDREQTNKETNEQEKAV